MKSAESYHLEVKTETTALDVLSQELPLSVAQLKEAATHGCIWWQSTKQKPIRIRRLKKTVKPGDQLHCYYDFEIISQDIMPAKLVADETDYSIWLKPRGMFSQGTKWGDANSISRFVEQTLDRPTWLVHRLDRMTAGLMILSHKKALVADFERAFTQKHIYKCYFAIVHGKFETLPLTIDMALDERASLTEITEAYHSPATDQSLIKVRILSGRKHQIRRHLAEVGHAVIGDRLYGNQALREMNVDLQLISQELKFVDPASGQTKHYQLSADTIMALMLPELSDLVVEAVANKGLE